VNYWVIFLTGLTTGGLSCLAMQGGLLASIITNQKEKEIDESASKKIDLVPVSMFLISKLVAHVFLGFLLGALGSQIQLSLSLRIIFQTLAALFMLATAANLLQLHPIFRYVVFQPPKFIQRLVRNTTKTKALFTPAILGVLTVFIPCGVTQAMEVLAITSGSPVVGALTMGAFVLGTLPIFAVVGLATAKLSDAFQQRFMKIAAWLLIVLGASGINGVLTVLDFPVTYQTITRPIFYYFSDERLQDMKRNILTVSQENGVQKVLIIAKNEGYSPTKVRVKAGVPVELTVQTKDAYTCASYFSFKAFNIKMQLGPNESQTATFTPTKPGSYQFTCSMGMYTGIMEVL